MRKIGNEKKEIFTNMCLVVMIVCKIQIANCLRCVVIGESFAMDSF